MSPEGATSVPTDLQSVGFPYCKFVIQRNRYNEYKAESLLIAQGVSPGLICTQFFMSPEGATPLYVSAVPSELFSLEP